jgi:hypothetical protein
MMLFQNANDLFFAETASLHRLSPQLENRLTKISGHFRGAGQAEFPDAKTSVRSVASVAAGLRKKGVDVPIRRKVKSND